MEMLTTTTTMMMLANAGDGDCWWWRAGNFVLGHGRIAHRACIVGGEDFTISVQRHACIHTQVCDGARSPQGGSPNTPGLRKSVATEVMALQHRCPLLCIVTALSSGPGPQAPLPPHSPPRGESPECNQRQLPRMHRHCHACTDTATHAPTLPCLHQGGGGSVAGAKKTSSAAGKRSVKKPPARVYEPDSALSGAPPRFQSVARVLGMVPVASAALGSVAGLPASRCRTG